MPREKIITVTIKDCDVETFRVSGAGGQRKDKRDTGVRIKHRASGAMGQSTDQRTQAANKRKAFTRMANSDIFQRWIRLEHARAVGDLDRRVEEMMRPENLTIECGSSVSQTSTTTTGT
jgi:protein subunit release factor B